MAFFLCRDGLVQEAERVFSALAASDPLRDGPVAGLALCAMIKGENAAALDALAGRIESDGKLKPEVCMYYIMALGLAGRLDEAAGLRRRLYDSGLTGLAARADRLLEEVPAIRANLTRQYSVLKND